MHPHGVSGLYITAVMLRTNALCTCSYLWQFKAWKSKRSLKRQGALQVLSLTLKARIAQQ